MHDKSASISKHVVNSFHGQHFCLTIQVEDFAPMDLPDSGEDRDTWMHFRTSRKNNSVGPVATPRQVQVTAVYD